MVITVLVFETTLVDKETQRERGSESMYVKRCVYLYEDVCFCGINVCK